MPPQIMPFLFGEDSFNTGDSTGVSCMIIKGDLPINIKWTLNGQPLINGEDGVTIAKLTAKSSVLTIGSIEKEHRGVFRCHAENMAGIAEYSSELHVNGISIGTKALYSGPITSTVLLILSLYR